MKKYFYLYLCAFIASFGGLLAGYDTGVISGALLYINQSFEINSLMLGLLVSSVSLGAVFGAFVNGFFVDRIGRRKTLLLSAFLFLLGSISCFFAGSIIYLIISRILIGVAVGVVSFCGPLYLSEISPKEKRGQIVSFHQVAITTGILFSYLINYYCANLAFNWRIMLLAGAIPSLIMFIAMFFQKDTPRWYVLKNRIAEAKQALRLTGACKDIDFEIEKIQKTLERSKTDRESDKKFECRLKNKLILPYIIGIGIMFVQIVTGINAIIYYAPTIFRTVGFTSNQDALFVTIFIGLINFLMTFVAVAFVDRIGRKPLLYIGLSGMMISLVVLSCVFVLDYSWIKYIAVIFCGLYVVSFSMSIGPVGLLLVSEVFPLQYRGNAMSIAIVCNFIFNAIVTGLFPIVLDRIGGFYTFLIFVSICMFSLLFVKFVVFETKNISLEEIEQRFG